MYILQGGMIHPRYLMMNRGGHLQQYIEIKCFEINFTFKKKDKTQF
jgi:hypothetical protein